MGRFQMDIVWYSATNNDWGFKWRFQMETQMAYFQMDRCNKENT